MARATIWLEREVGALIIRWLGGLADWTPFSGAGEASPCLTCARYSPSLQLTDVPHPLLHSLASPLDDLVADCFLMVVASRYEVLLDDGWTIALDNGLVRVLTPNDGWPHGEEPAPAPDVAQLRLALTGLHTDLLSRAVYTVQQHHTDLVAAVDATVEPVLRRMAAQLIDEVCGS